jgi:hypothetical protein
MDFFLGIRLCLNEGIMGWWNDGIYHLPNIGLSQDPFFQYSNIPIGEKALI